MFSCSTLASILTAVGVALLCAVNLQNAFKTWMCECPTNEMVEYNNDIRNRIQELEYKVTKIEEKRRESNEYINNLESKIQGLMTKEIPSGKETLPRQQPDSTTAFFATSEAHRIYSSGQTLLFENVLTNIGEAFYPASGIFITPSSGVYVFFTTVLGSNNVELWNNIAVNEKRVVNFNSHGTGGRHDDGTASVVLQLSKGDVVSVKNGIDNGNTHGDNYTHFGGFQIG